MIDHSLLGPALTDQELEDGCRLAVQYGAASVCIKPYFVKRAAELLKGTGVNRGRSHRLPARQQRDRIEAL